MGQGYLTSLPPTHSPAKLAKYEFCYQNKPAGDREALLCSWEQRENGHILLPVCWQKILSKGHTRQHLYKCTSQSRNSVEQTSSPDQPHAPAMDWKSHNASGTLQSFHLRRNFLQTGTSTLLPIPYLCLWTNPLTSSSWQHHLLFLVTPMHSTCSPWQSA